MSLLEIRNLHVNVDGNEILKGIDLTLNAGEVHSIMGPNGSGKSTLAQVLARRDAYNVTEGSITFDGKDLLEMKPEEAACEGVFLAFQYPVEITSCGRRSMRSGSIAGWTKWMRWTFCPCSARSWLSWRWTTS